MLRAVMTVVDGPYQGRRMLVRPGSALLIGRTERAEWVVPHDVQMSGLHLSVEFEGDALVVRDLGSTNGTWLGTQRITEHVLQEGDVFRAGTTQFSVHIEQSRTVPDASQLLAARGQSGVTMSSVPPSAPASSAPGPTEAGPTEAPPKAEQIPVGASRQSALPQRPTISEKAHVGGIEGTMVVEIRSATHAGEVIWIRPGQSVSVGSSSQVDRSFANVVGLADRHFALDFLDQSLHLVDLSSGQPTYVNNQLATIVRLNVGDIVKAGTLELVVRGSNSSPNVAADLSGNEARTRHAAPMLRDMAALQRHVILSDADPEVRREALEAAAWNREPWVVDLGREMSRNPDPQWNNLYYVFAVLGQPEELAQISRLLKSEHLGAERLHLATAFAHPALVPDLLRFMASDNVEEAQCAAAAFERMLGVETTTAEIAVRGTLPSSEAVAESETESNSDEGETVEMPDVSTASARWHSLQSQLASATRIYRGIIVNDAWDEAQANRFDLETRWELFLRARYYGRWRGTPTVLQRLTCRLG